ncbi:hypothetical protein E2320_005661 [Naja naja]|nr:hypothetical protein E2320_005661 [Naja naja]
MIVGLLHSGFDSTPRLRISGLDQSQDDSHTTSDFSSQIQGESRTCKASRQVKYKGVLGTISTMVKMEGPKSLYKGLVAGLQRQMSFASVRIGLYDSVKELYTPKGSERTFPNITRNAIVNCGEMVTYDLIKETLLKYHLMTDNFPCHFVAAFGAGFCATVVASPVDVVKTRYMNSSAGQYKNALSCMLTMVVKEGPNAFYKGFLGKHPSEVRRHLRQTRYDPGKRAKERREKLKGRILNRGTSYEQILREGANEKENLFSEILLGNSAIKINYNELHGKPSASSHKRLSGIKSKPFAFSLNKLF